MPPCDDETSTVNDAGNQHVGSISRSGMTAGKENQRDRVGLLNELESEIRHRTKAMMSSQRLDFEQLGVLPTPWARSHD